jgi:RHS repeat-associated protein
VEKGTLSGSACTPTTLYYRGASGESIDEINPSTYNYRNVYFNGQMIARTRSDGTIWHIVPDQIGSTRLTINGSTSAVTGDVDYDPYGIMIPQPPGTPDSSSDPYKFTGKERDTESGNDYFGARYYGSSMGRMLSPDSGVDQHPENPQSWNLYSYGLNNPLMYTDPTGEYVCGSGVTQSMCDNFQKTLDAAQTGANALKDKYGADSTQYKDAQRAIDAYGKEGVDNGVTVNATNMRPGDAAGVQREVGSVTPTKDNPNGQQITVNFGKDMFSGSADNAPDAAHEGSHIADASDWVSSGFSPSMNPTRYGTEWRAFHVEQSMAEGMGQPFLGFYVGGQPIYVWKPGWTAAQVNSGINQVLNNPAGHYHLTPNSKVLAFIHNTKGGN